MKNYEEKLCQRTTELAILRDKQAAVMKRLELAFDTDTHRELSLINQKIRVREEQIKGGWTKNQPPNYSTF